jgi:hypothetical protein
LKLVIPANFYAFGNVLSVYCMYNLIKVTLYTHLIAKICIKLALLYKIPFLIGNINNFYFNKLPYKGTENKIYNDLHLYDSLYENHDFMNFLFD